MSLSLGSTVYFYRRFQLSSLPKAILYVDHSNLCTCSQWQIIIHLGSLPNSDTAKHSTLLTF